jgi:hypothetical protein
MPKKINHMISIICNALTLLLRHNHGSLIEDSINDRSQDIGSVQIDEAYK